MSAATELLLLRLGLIAIVFAFAFATAMTMRAGLRSTVVAMPMRRAVARLVLIVPGETGLAAGTEFAVAAEMTIGRDSGNGIALGDPSVSSRHARIARVDGRWTLTDLGSTNGTAVDGRAVDGRSVTLGSVAELTLGAVVLRFQA